MSILIKNMEMPKKGHFLFQISANGDVWVSNRNDEGTGIIIAKAIELPPYGRLIDADKLEKAAEKMAVCDSYEYTIAHEMVKKLLKIAPTVLEASNE